MCLMGGEMCLIGGRVVPHGGKICAVCWGELCLMVARVSLLSPRREQAPMGRCCVGNRRRLREE